MANRLTLYFTSDTHGYVYPTDFISPGTLSQGLLRMPFHKDGNTLIIDGGDTLQGSPLTYFCRTKGRPMPCADVMNDLRYDYITLGNHDFNYGYATLQDYLQRSNAQCLCANVHDQDGQLPILSYAVHTLQNGFRVGLIGIVTHWINLWEKPENLGSVTVSDTMEAARNAVDALHGQYDVLIGIYHGGFERDVESGKLLSETDENIGWRLCEALPFDVLLTGHQHIPMANKVIHGTHIAQTPGNARACVRLTIDQNGMISSRLCEPDAEPMIKPWDQTLYGDLTQWLDTPIGRLSRALAPEAKLAMALHGSPIADFINQVQLEASGAQISCAALSNEVSGFKAKVTVRDVVSSYPFANTLVVLRVTGQVLKTALEQCATYFKVSDTGKITIGDFFTKPKEAHYNYDYFAGIAYTFDLRKPIGERVVNLTYQGSPVTPDNSFSLVMNNYRATGAGGFDCYLPCPREKEIQTEVSELILNYLSEHTPIQIPDSNPYTIILPRHKTLIK
ncbi:MAG TPA: bifunctional UDP-sugar hydrolase/5'-nucleotidase [Candidatus Limiplasma sp.]|nr:bifunctional UDP-sugar hydrolase/5'-nucleotidase [Candidatus Limiplasma sp.]HRX09609.1 bifunctional UDP-sugar hydrolase/5'-nucleotidase [Candidatus Limiplasma sp.]